MANLIYNSETIRRALDSHVAAGRITRWRQISGRRTAPWMASVALVGGDQDFRLTSLDMAFAFVSALASAHRARFRDDNSLADRIYGQLIKAFEQDMPPEATATMIARALRGEGR